MEDGNLPLPTRPAVTVEAAFTARFPGQCNACDLPVAAGDRIAKLSTGAYVHERCT
jgi:hypothetical protein